MQGTGRVRISRAWTAVGKRGRKKRMLKKEKKEACSALLGLALLRRFHFVSSRPSRIRLDRPLLGKGCIL